MHSSDSTLRLIMALVEQAGGTVVITAATIEDVYLNSTAEYNWRLETLHLPDGAVSLRIEKGVVHPDQIPMDFHPINQSDEE